jgi:hypothetical protein
MLKGWHKAEKKREMNKQKKKKKREKKEEEKGPLWHIYNHHPSA